MLDTHAAEAIVQVQLKTLHQGLATKEDLFRAASAIKEELSDYRVETEKRFGEVEKHFSALEGNLGEFKVEVERRFGRLTVLTWVVLVIVLLSNPIAARLLERLLGVPF